MLIYLYNGVYKNNVIIWVSTVSVTMSHCDTFTDLKLSVNKTTGTNEKNGTASKIFFSK